MNRTVTLFFVLCASCLAAEEPAAEIGSIHALVELAGKAVAQGELEQAQSYFEKALSRPVPNEAKREALAGLADLLDNHLHAVTRAAAVYEQLCSLYPQDPEVPRYTLRLGHLYRDLGSFKSAINKLYSVLNSSLRYGDGDAYRKLTQQAQFEIAETYFSAGEYPRAASYFQRLTKLDLPEEQKTEAEFKYANLLYLMKDYPAALAAAQRFLPSHADHALAAEAEYLVVQSLRALHRDEEALNEALKILRAGKKVSKEQPAIWAYWRQKTGNDLANNLYAKSDILHALQVYQVLAEVSEEPAWRWPAVYQIGLCFERLRQPERAAQAYQYLLKQPAPGPSTASAPKEGDLSHLQLLREMAQWRATHLQWVGETEAVLSQLVLPHSEPPRRPELRTQLGLRAQSAEPPPTTASREETKTASAPQ